MSTFKLIEIRFVLKIVGQHSKYPSGYFKFEKKVIIAFELGNPLTLANLIAIFSPRGTEMSGYQKGLL